MINPGDQVPSSADQPLEPGAAPAPQDRGGPPELPPRRGEGAEAGPPAGLARLRESEARYRAIVEASASMVWTADAQGRVLEDSPSWRSFTGQSREEWRARGWVEAVHPEDRGHAARHWADALAAGATLDAEFRLRHARGGWRMARLHAVPLRDEAGRVSSWIGIGADIEDLHQAQVALAESEARFRSLADHAPVMMWVTDQDGHCTYLNRLWYQFTGQDPATAEGLGWIEAAHPEDRAWLEEAFWRANARREPFRLEYRLRRHDGAYRWVIDAAAPRFGPGGEFLGYGGSVIDIDERHEIEHRLRESEQRLQLAKQAAGIGVWDWSLLTGEITWSPEMYALLGVDPTTSCEHLQDTWARVLDPDVRREVEARAQASSRAGQSFSLDFPCRHPDGETRWIRSQAITMADAAGRPCRMIGINLDVTAQHREEERLRERAESAEAEVEARTRERDRIFELSHDLFAVMSYDGYLKVVNPAWSRLLGFSEEEILRRPASIAVHPDDQAGIAELLGRLKAGQHVAGFEDRLLRADGSVVWVSWTCVPGDDGHFYAVGRDVTREKEREEIIRQAQKMEAVGQLTGGIAHDFNNVLGALMGSLDLIRLRSGDAAAVRRFAEAGLQAAERGTKLTGQLLAFSRAQRIELKPVAIAALVAGMRDLLARTLGPMIRVSFMLDGDGAVLSDPTQIEMAVLNLAINARDAMPEGGTLTITTAARRVSGDVELAPGEYVELAVADTGSGMAPEVAARAFDPFFTTKGIGRGTGLGLSQVYGIARQAGGTVRIESRPGAGTTVRIYLPRTTAPVPPSPEPEKAGLARPGGGLTVLVVDDDRDVRNVITAALDALGYRVLEAGDGPAGLAMLEAEKPALMVLDFAMPGMNGAEVAKAAWARRPELPIVFASGYADTAAIEAVAGQDAMILRKPFRVEELHAVLAEALGGQPRPAAP